MYSKYRGSMLTAGVIAFAAALSGTALAQPPADWSQIPTKTVKLFYPGQSSYQWLRSSEHKRANRKTEKGDSCISCHEGEEIELGQLIVSGERLEPHPIKGKQAVIDLAVQSAHDNDNLYFRFQWKTKNPYPGSAHPHWQFDGKEWKAMMLFGMLAFFGGVGVFVFGAATLAGDAVLEIAFIVGGLGLGLAIVGKIGAWWCHG